MFKNFFKALIKANAKEASKGFSLLEIMVTITIMTMIMTTIMMNTTITTTNTMNTNTTGTGITTTMTTKEGRWKSTASAPTSITAAGPSA